MDGFTASAWYMFGIGIVAIIAMVVLHFWEKRQRTHTHRVSHR